MDRRIIALSTGFGIGIWILDAGLDTLFFYEDSFLSLLLLDIPPHELYIRTIILLSFVLFGVGISWQTAHLKSRDREVSLFRTLLDEATDSIFVIDPDSGAFIDVNETACDLLGYDRSTLLTMDVADINPTFDNAVEFHQFTQTEGRTLTSYESTHIRADGTTVPVEISASNVTIDDQSYRIAIARDITDRKEHDQELERHLDLFEKAQDIANVGAWEYDIQTEEGWWTDEACRIHGLSTDVTPTPELSLQHYHPEDRPRIREAFNRAIEEGEPYDLELRFIDDSGQRKWVRTQGEPQPADGDPVRVRGTIQDITNRKEREQDLQASQERYESLFTSIRDAIVVADTDRHITDCNPAFADLFGYSQEEIEGESTTILYEDPAEFEAMGEALQQHADDPQFTRILTYETKTGHTFPGETNVSFLRDADGDLMGFIGLIRDVSARQERIRQIKMIDRVLRHNLHNDMNVILGCADQVRTISSGDAIKYAETISEKGTQLLETTDKEREVTKFLADAPSPSSQDAVELVTTTVERIQNHYPDADITVEIPEEQTVIVIAVERIGTAIAELVENAIIHSDQDTPSVTVRLRTEGERVQIGIADNGPGIPEMERRVLTEGEEIQPLYHGSGFGLWLANLLVTHSHGTLTITENEPRGTIVTIHLPTEYLR